MVSTRRSLWQAVLLGELQPGLWLDHARTNVRQRRWLKRWVGIDLPGQSEEKQKPYWVMLGVVFLLLGVAMIVVGGYWWMT